MLKKFTTLLALSLLASHAFSAVTYVGDVLIDGKAKDLSQLAYTLEDGSPADALDGFGSGIAYTGITPAPNTYRFISITDRGPNRTPFPAGAAVDNTISYPTRAQTWDLTLAPTSDGKYACSAALVKTTLFTDEAGRHLVGRSDQFSSPNPSANLRFDPESIRVAPDGSLYVSDEYGPSIYHFDSNGKRIGILKVPAWYQVQHLSAQGNEEIQNNTIGRVANKGFEGLAITPDGSQLIAAIQSPLLQDGGEKSRFERFAIFNTSTGELVKEVVYPLDASTKGENIAKTTISDIVALNDHQMLVDERDSKKNNTKLAYIADLSTASEVTGRSTLLLNDTLDPTITPAKKTLLFDVRSTILASNPLTNVPAGYTTGIPDKIEGFVFGPLLPDGKRLFVVTNDNDFDAPPFLNGKSASNKSPDGSAGYPNYFFFFAVDPQSIPTFQEEQFLPARITAQAP